MEVVEALPSDRADHAFHVGVLPRRSRGSTHGLNVHGGNSGRDVCEDRIAVGEEIRRRVVLRKVIGSCCAVQVAAGQQSPKYGSASPEGEHGKPTARNQSKKDQG